MPPFFRFIFTRLFSFIITLLVITVVLYSLIMLVPVEERASLYFPKNMRVMSDKQIIAFREMIIKRHHLRDPFPIQYMDWVSNLVKGDWGYSPALGAEVLPALLQASPVTAELTLYSLLFYIPLGLISGAVAASRRFQRFDNTFRLAAFTGTSLPPFILAIVLLVIFYVDLYWFPPERLGIEISQDVRSPSFKAYTGLMTVDGLLNGRPDVSEDAVRHLVLPVITLSLLHWATLGRVTRAQMIEELDKEYITAARGRGLSSRRVIWRHAFRNALPPSLTSTALSAASLFTGVFMIEVIFDFHGISRMIVGAVYATPDTPAVMGFAVYSVIVVLLLMLVLDVSNALINPLLRRGELYT
jgi:ABC-type dipeptide/oligopeptide/nickel transport system permease component